MNPRQSLLALLALAPGCGDGDSPPQAKPVECEPTLVGPAFEAMTVKAVHAALWTKSRSEATPMTTERGAHLAKVVEALTRASTQCFPPSTIEALAAAAEFEIRWWELGGQHYAALLEASTLPPTAGATIVRLGPTATDTGELLIQAPHAFFDVGTGRIAVAAFFALGGRARAFFTNTQHRHMQRDGSKEPREDNPADAAHNAAHPLALATAAALRSLDRATVVQIHGFGRTREVAGAPNAQAVISAGDRSGSSAATTHVAESIRAALGIEVARFPEDTSSLGATRNVERAIAAEVAGTRFVHIELGASIRQRLSRDPNAAALFARALLPGPPPTDGNPEAR